MLTNFNTFISLLCLIFLAVALGFVYALCIFFGHNLLLYYFIVLTICCLEDK